MLRRRIRSALYIDFENVPLPPDAIGNWLAWLEDGVFDPAGTHRRFLQKRVYWNSHAERNRGLFERHGFAPILIGKYSGLKNGADIRMAMDVVETTYIRSDIQEFILLTGDSDFVPVIERLKEKSKRSAIVATEHRPNIHTTYHRNADLLIPSRRLTEAAQYKRPSRSLLSRLLKPKITAPPRTEKALPATAASSGSPVRSNDRRRDQGPPIPEAPEPTSALEIAARRVAKLLTQQPRNYVSQKRVMAELDRVQGFKRQGPTAYFGTGSYKALLRELSRIEERITVVDQPGGGTGVVYIPSLPHEAQSEPSSPSTNPHPEDAPVAPGTTVASQVPTAVNGADHATTRPEADAEERFEERDGANPVSPASGESNGEVAGPIDIRSSAAPSNETVRERAALRIDAQAAEPPR